MQKQDKKTEQSRQKGTKVSNKKYIRFDWAAKNILRNKADFVVFEGFISVLVKEKVTIVELLESESNKENENAKYNRVDIKAKNSKGEIILVEIQQSRELDYLQRMLYGVAKAITEHMKSGKAYENVKKVFSINILYFKLGEGTDYLYHGQTVLKGVHDGDTLSLTEHERDDLKVTSPQDVFPEYYVIRVNEFNKLAADPLEEWMRYLKDEYISPDTTVPGLREAKERLEYLRMSPEQQREYDYYLDTLVRDTDVMKTKLLEARIEGEKQGRAKGHAEGHAEGLEKGRAEGLEKGRAEGLETGRAEGLEKGRAEGIEKGRAEGLEKGRAEGLEKGRAKEKFENAKKMKTLGATDDFIMQVTGLTLEELQGL
jgi:predicted transposase/invertase (TIGR01784 family)